MKLALNPHTVLSAEPVASFNMAASLACGPCGVTLVIRARTFRVPNSTLCLRTLPFIRKNTFYFIGVLKQLVELELTI